MFFSEGFAQSRLSVCADLKWFIKRDSERRVGAVLRGDGRMGVLEGELEISRKILKIVLGKNPDLRPYFVLSSSGSPVNITAYGWLLQGCPR